MITQYADFLKDSILWTKPHDFLPNIYNFSNILDLEKFGKLIC